MVRKVSCPKCGTVVEVHNGNKKSVPCTKCSNKLVLLPGGSRPVFARIRTMIDPR